MLIAVPAPKAHQPAAKQKGADLYFRATHNSIQIRAVQRIYQKCTRCVLRSVKGGIGNYTG